jgi:hypothetical protein
VEFIARASQIADLPDLVGGDPNPRAWLGGLQPASDLLLAPDPGQRALGDLPVGPQLVQLPAQLVDQPSASINQPLAIDSTLADL